MIMKKELVNKIGPTESKSRLDSMYPANSMSLTRLELRNRVVNELVVLADGIRSVEDGENGLILIEKLTRSLLCSIEDFPLTQHKVWLLVVAKDSSRRKKAKVHSFRQKVERKAKHVPLPMVMNKEKELVSV